jgi:hypothetical protein
MSVLFVFAVVRGAIIGWFFLPGIIINLPFFVKIIIFLFIISFTFNRVAQTMMGELVKIFKLFFVYYLANCRALFYSSLWWLRVLAVKWVTFIEVGRKLVRVGDHGWIEILGPQGLYNKISSYSWLRDVVSFTGFRKLMFGYLVLILSICYFIVCLDSLNKELGFEGA